MNTPKPKKGQTIELVIEKMANGGSAVGRWNGFVVFVRGGVPGDVVKVRVVKRRRAFAEARIEAIIQPSSDRVTASCPYAGYCGGCQWQHVAYDSQLRHKHALVTEPLEHIGGLTDVAVHPVIPSSEIFGYRNKMEFSFSDRRWFLPHELNLREQEGDFALGLHVPGAFQKVIDIEECLLQKETGNRILRAVKTYVKDSGLPVYGLKSHEGFWRYLTIRSSAAFDTWMVNVVTSTSGREVIRPLAERLHDTIPSVTTVINNINRRKASIAVGDTEEIISGKGVILDRIGPYTFRISANSFFQTHPPAARKLYEQVVAFARPQGHETLVDLYSGTGTIPLYVSDRVRSVVGMELSGSAISDAMRNCVENGIHNCRFICGDVRETLAELDQQPHILIIDPPRAGMHKDVLKGVLELAPERIVYVSCNPATLARDLGQMAQAYHIHEIQPVDMFPNTYHVEAVARLSRKFILDTR
ncbi:MAG: 23S rRNA (uracil(1939)-C(5))-methyltransferase RlmD [Deltaproteobacteria bacterium]|nr:23S rRNA (uracil(1939)-C(5))-methyltransferase RlmD [Deltaproteobacteria bacterium]